jgi:hypothetical protein
MKHTEAKRIKVGDRVTIWAGTPDQCHGTAIEVGYNAVKFAWDDEQVGVIHHRDMANVERIPASDAA